VFSLSTTRNPARPVANWTVLDIGGHSQFIGSNWPTSSSFSSLR
jgi:hypothetical protein